MIDITLKNIILKRRFGPIAIGSDIQDVARILGEPDARGSLDSGTEIFRYGRFEFIFEEEKLILFFNKRALDDDYNFSIDFHYSNTKFKIKTWFLDFKEDIKIKHFEKWLNQENIKYTKDAFWDSIKLIIDVNTEIMFYNNKMEGSDVKSSNELTNNQGLFEDEENWVFTGFYVFKSKDR